MNRKNAILGVGVIVVAVVLLIVLSSGGSDDKSSHLAGANLGFDYGLTDFVSVSLEQGVFYNAFSGNSGIGGRSAAGLDFTLGRGTLC